MRRKTLRQKWHDYAWFRSTRRLDFDDRHPDLRWFPTIIALAFVTVTGVAVGLNYMRPGSGLGGYLQSLVAIDFGMAAVAALSWILGRALWREDHDHRYLWAAIGFAALPVWGVLETLCVTFMIPAFSTHEACMIIPDSSWIAILVLFVVPFVAVLVDFRGYLIGKRREAGSARGSSPLR